MRRRELKSERLSKKEGERGYSPSYFIRGHGVYIWGPTWEKAKMMAECYDYLFEIAIKLKQLGASNLLINTQL